jgi:hypothetical protein
MKALTATLRLYRDALVDAVKALPRSWPALLALMIFSVMMAAVGSLLAPLPYGVQLAAGFVVALIHAGCVGSYLSLLEISVTQQRRLQFSEIQESFGTYLWDVISVLFIFFIAQLVLGMLLPMGGLLTILSLVAMFVFNPAPELIYQGHTRGLDLLRDAAQVVRRSGLEWFPPQIVLLGVLAWLMPTQLTFLLQAFGPFFGFMEVGSLFFAQLLYMTPGPEQIGGFVASALAVHFMMLFRGFLFAATRRGGRRLRAWQERLRED